MVYLRCYYSYAKVYFAAYSGHDIKRQSRMIFVENHLKHIAIGAEHHNIYIISD
jgi:hypothetical protein